jgi:hypothetical protein
MKHRVAARGERADPRLRRRGVGWKIVRHVGPVPGMGRLAEGAPQRGPMILRHQGREPAVLAQHWRSRGLRPGVPARNGLPNRQPPLIQRVVHETTVAVAVDYALFEFGDGRGNHNI